MAKTENESTFFSVFYHRLKFWTLNFNAPQLLQKTFSHHGFLFNNIYLHVYYYRSKFVGLVAKLPVYVCVCINVCIDYAYLLNSILCARLLQCQQNTNVGKLRTIATSVLESFSKFKYFSQVSGFFFCI